MIDNLGSSLWGNLLFAANPYSTPPTIPIKITQGGKNLLHRCRGSFITSYWPYTQSFYVSYLLLIVFSLFFSTPMYICNSDGSKRRCTFVYGEPKASQRYVMWELLRRVKSLGFGPWFMVGDFNGAMWQHEHFSRHKRSSKLMANFSEILSGCNLFDLGFQGLPWTFDNKQMETLM